MWPLSVADGWLTIDILYLSLSVWQSHWQVYVKLYLCLELKEIENDGSGDGGQYIYWQVRFPFPLSNRDVSLPHYILCSSAYII